MNIKFLILNILIVGLFGYDAKNITKLEYKDLEKLDQTIYNLSTKQKTYNISKVVFFIYKHLGYDLDFTRLKISSSLNLRHNSSNTLYNDTQTLTDKNSYSANLNLSYPIFDPKESNDRKKQIISLKQKIITEVQNYFKLKAKLDDLKIELKILDQLEIRLKARKLNGVGGFKEWLDIVKNIKKTSYDITITTLELTEQKQILLSYVSSKFYKTLEDIL